MKVFILTMQEISKMNSKLPKVLNEIMGKKMINYCIDALKETGLFTEMYVCTSEKSDMFKEAVDESINFISYEQLANILGKEDVLIIKADSPLVTPETIESYYAVHINGNKDVTISPSFVFIKGNLAASLLVNGNIETEPYSDQVSDEFIPVNTKAALCQATEILQKRINENHMRNGVTIVSLSQTYISPGVTIGCDTVIYPNTYLYGDTSIGQDCCIGPDTSLKDVIVGDNTQIIKSTAEDSRIGDYTNIGPYAYVRPGSSIGNHVKVGDFVEVKNSVIGDKTKASHLTYIGDSLVGKNVNFGCGTVVVNYNGKKKQKTVINDNAFIGCNANLIAPVKINDSAYIAAGSTITDDVPEDSLAIARARQVVKLNWKKK